MPKTPKSRYAHGPAEYKERPAFAAAVREGKLRLGQRLRALRDGRKLTRLVASENAGLHPVTLARIEAGQANATIGTLIALAVAYEVPVSALFGGEEHLTGASGRTKRRAASTETVPVAKRRVRRR